MTDLALQLAVLRVLADQIKAGREVLATEVRDTWKVGTRNIAELPDETRVGSVTLTKSRMSAKVVDRDAFTGWVKQHHPTEIEETVRPAYETQIRADIVKTGEAVPGVEITEGDPYPSVRLDDGATEAIRKAWENGELSWSILPEIER